MIESENSRQQMPKRPRFGPIYKIPRDKVDRYETWGGWNVDQNNSSLPVFRKVARNPNSIPEMTRPTESHTDN